MEPFELSDALHGHLRIFSMRIHVLCTKLCHRSSHNRPALSWGFLKSDAMIRAQMKRPFYYLVYVVSGITCDTFGDISCLISCKIVAAKVTD